MTELDLWQQPTGFPRADYFETVHDALKTTGITPEAWWQGDPWEGAITLDEDTLAGTRYAGCDEVVVAWRVEQDCEPKHADDFEGEGWYLVTARGDNRNVVDLPDLPYLAEPDEVARVVAEQLVRPA